MFKKIPLAALFLSFLFSSFILPQNNDIEGAYKLVLRKLSDGTRIMAPDIKGLMTYTETSRNFNVAYKDKNGKYFSYSVISNYKLTDKDYTETIQYSLMNDEAAGKELTYQMEEKSATVPVKKVDGNLEIKMPFDPVTVTFNGDRITAKGDQFTDYWEKIKE
ncbi:MAG TPA: hypothetical protein VLN45_13545 [Ignavibacteriaceae bacterium]|nr:hypothetical protein [Ignavibacteriaceae bacterium]